MDTVAEQTANRGYFVTDIAGQRVEVCFEPLTANDTDTLNEEDWKGARFGAVWREWAEHEIALKLVRCDKSENAILGIVKIGTTRRPFGRGNYLKESLLETAPIFRYNANERRYRGIGKVLVARLIVDNQVQGAEGRLRVHPASGSVPFYLNLGFLRAGSNYCVLSAEKAEQLMATVRRVSG